MQMRTYTSKDIQEMDERFTSGLWKEDDVEYKNFRLMLTNADTSARLMANRIEYGMAEYGITQGRNDRFEAFWLLEYRTVLGQNFSREELLRVMQRSFHYRNKQGFDYVEDIEIMQAIWESFK